MLTDAASASREQPHRWDFQGQRAQLNVPGYLFVLPWSLAAVGGVNQVVCGLYQRAARGREVSPFLLVTCWDNPKEDEYVKSVMQKHLRLRDPYAERRRLKAIAGFLLHLPGSLWTLAQFLRAQRVAVVNPHFPTLSSLHFALLKRLGLFGGALVFALHGAEIQGAARSRGIERFLWRFLLRSADSITACSRSLASLAVNFDSVLANRVKVVYNAVDEADRTSDASRIGDSLRAGENERVVLNIAKFEHKKGQDVLIRAYKHLLRNHQDVRLVLVGAAGPALDQVQEMVSTDGLQDRIELYVNVPHQRIWRFLAKASIFVLCSRIEPFGIVILEAGLSEVPVIASAVGGVPEIMSDGINGRLVPPEDPIALANAISLLLDQPGEARRMAKKLRQDVLARFNWEICFQGYLEAAGLG